jgi:hypothetical protein
VLTTRKQGFKAYQNVIFNYCIFKMAQLEEFEVYTTSQICSGSAVFNASLRGPS